eukprot:2282801-Alexandrium_andersonii.AAC.1
MLGACASVGATTIRCVGFGVGVVVPVAIVAVALAAVAVVALGLGVDVLSLIHISEPTRLALI